MLQASEPQNDKPGSNCLIFQNKVQFKRHSSAEVLCCLYLMICLISSVGRASDEKSEHLLHEATF